MSNKIILTAEDLDGYLTKQDKKNIDELNEYYSEAMKYSEIMSGRSYEKKIAEAKNRMIQIYDKMGKKMHEIANAEKALNVYSFKTPRETHGEASRLIAKLRNPETQHDEFVYYIQRAYELLFNLTFNDNSMHEKNYLITETPVDIPLQNYAVHKIPDVDEQIENSVICVMLRGALLPSMILSKEIQEYSSSSYVPPFSLFKIKRDDSKKEYNMEYILDLDKSFFTLDDLDGKDLIFADPMNATGGSLVTIMKYILDQGIKPKSIKFINVISALKGSLRVIRAIENVEVYTLWMDPVLNELAYILPGLGDAGDRLNGVDKEENPRNIIQLIADYGSNIANLYRSQVQKIEETVLGK
ncbi:MAG: uracil phosphoribosyltransferase [Spirochaetia bacterium]|nr:uracil phosphoribosyltransferase [Spirochaetia bacterium]MCF7946615.1 uracil phosphoribosyltransferase [Spirochaetia bacterium]MCF7952815.1 uracil phosphoribosyltransferase [Spirochaetales bacterium]